MSSTPERQNPHEAGEPAGLFALDEGTPYQREQLLRSILNTAVDAIVIINRQGIIQLVNPATESMFGYTRDELIGQNVNLLMPQPFRDAHDSYLARYLETREPHIIGIGREVFARRKDGSTFPVDLAVSEIDHFGYFTGMVRDVTQRKDLQRHVLEILKEEQTRIGQELHDGTGQELTGLSMYAATLLKTLESLPLSPSETEEVRILNDNTFQKLKSMATRLTQGLGETTRSIKKLAHGMVPVQIDAEGLRVALQDLADLTNVLPDVDCRFLCSGQFRIADNSIATHLYRIGQEALSNALRHGHATQIDIEIIPERGQIILEVRDNGTGIESVAPHLPVPGKPRGMGLRTMEYRAGLIGGRLQVSRIPEGGTVVRCIVPQFSDMNPFSDTKEPTPR